MKSEFYSKNYCSMHGFHLNVKFSPFSGSIKILIKVDKGLICYFSAVKERHLLGVGFTGN